MSKDANNVYTVEDVVSIRDRVHEVEKLVFDTARHDGQDVIISIPLDPAAAAGAYAKDLQRKLAEMGFSVRLCKPVKSKITRFAPFSSIAQAGFVNVVKANWNKDFFDELEIFNGERANKDDQVDCCSDAMILLNKDMQLPSFTLPDFTGTNPFDGSISGNNIPSYNGVTIG
jgi:predicted phage terminase large subunit-like protein